VVDAEVASVTPVGARPLGLAASFGAIWVANNTSNSVSRISVADGSVIATTPVEEGPFGVAADETDVWVTSYFADTLTRFDARTGRRTGAMHLGDAPSGIAVSGDWIAAVSNGSNSVSLLRRAPLSTRDGAFAQPAKLVATLPVGGSPFGVAFTGGTVARLWVTSLESDTVLPIDLPTIPLRPGGFRLP
jgi:YVTN family beta-propeller protein